MLITSLIIHYKRPENIPLVIKGIRSQTIPSKIIVWDNSGNYPKGSGEDVLITSTENIHCLARILIAGMVKTEYIYNQDDDLAIKDNRLFEKFIDMSKKYPDYVIGWNGRKFHEDINWEQAYSFPHKNGVYGGWVDSMDINNSQSIDIINYGVSFLRTELINQVKINPFKLGYNEDEYKHGDDIIVSSQLEKKRTMDFKLVEHFDWLNEYQERGAALSKLGAHMSIRDGLCKKLYKGKYK